ncbi:uncharacterized protein LOC122570071 [Bombus pyrosoma]|uniref:uncharacterized protein LOC122570071 n=1 Tax=Bombus pyrosoma TaxID=396416 RepID=UPI001CB8CA6C|nr:uncharacterized protein LOC122570071 [Bombus pyrosoma]
MASNIYICKAVSFLEFGCPLNLQGGIKFGCRNVTRKHGIVLLCLAIRLFPATSISWTIKIWEIIVKHEFLQNRYDVNYHCMTFAKRESAYNSDARLFSSFCKTDRDETYPVFFPGH